MADQERRQPANMAFVLLEEAIAAREMSRRFRHRHHDAYYLATEEEFLG
jgi:hypothetical protein